MKVTSFLGVIDLGFGVILLAAMNLTFGMCSLLTNLNDWQEARNKISAVITIFCLLYMIIIWIYASYGSYNSYEYPEIMSKVYKNWTAFFITWILFLLFSLHSDLREYVCIKGHCPESLWLYNNTWNEKILIQGFKMGLNKFEDKVNMTNAGMYRDIFNSSLLNAVVPISLFSSHKKVKSYSNDVDWNMIIIIIHVVFYFVIFTYGWVVLYSFDIKLKLAKLNKKDSNS